MVGCSYHQYQADVELLKQMGVRAFFKEAWNIEDVFTIGLSLQTVGERPT